MKRKLLLIIIPFFLWTNLANALGVGGRVPNISLPLLNKPAVKINLSGIKAKYLLVDFWASWCGPCKYSMPELSKLARELNPKGLKVVGVALDNTPSKARGFLKGHPVPFTQLSDTSKAAAKAFGVPKVPTSFLIGPNKTIIAVYYGYDKKHIADIKRLVK